MEARKRAARTALIRLEVGEAEAKDHNFILILSGLKSL